MSEPDDRIVLTLDQIREWAQEEEDTKPLYYVIDLNDFIVHISRNENMGWEYGVGSKDEHYQGWSSGIFQTRSEMAKKLLEAMREMRNKIYAENVYIEVLRHE